MRLLIAFVVWIGAVAAAVALSSAVAGSIHSHPAAAGASSTRSSGNNSGTGSGSSGTPFDPSSVQPTDPRSLFLTANLARALGAARAHLGAGARIDMLALYPGYIVMTAVKGGGGVDVNIAADGSYTQTSTGGNPGGLPLFSLTQVKANVPSVLAQRIATSGHVAERQLNYMVAEVDPSNNHFRWLVYPRHGNRVEYFTASGATGPLLELRSNSATGLQPVRG